MLFGLLSCRETLAHLDDYLDRELSPRETYMVARHLKMCHKCAHAFAFEAAFIADLHDKLDHLEVPPQLLENVRRVLEAEKSGVSGTESG